MDQSADSMSTNSNEPEQQQPQGQQSLMIVSPASVSMLELAIREKDLLIDKLNKKLTDQNERMESLERISFETLDNQRRLTTSVQRDLNNATEQNQELLVAVSEMKELLKKAKESNKDLEQAFNDSRSEFEDMLASKNREIEQLNQRLRESRTHAQPIDSIVSLHQQMQTGGWTSLSKSQLYQIQSRFEDTLNDLRNENESLRDEIRHLREEHDRNAPYLHQQAMEHNLAVEKADQLQRQICDLIEEREVTANEHQVMKQKLSFFERECARYEQENRDLSTQCCHLLRVIEQERGMIIRDDRHLKTVTSPTNVKLDEDGKPIVNASSVIDSHLVTFRSIEELQKKNQHILTIIRQLSARNEELEARADDSVGSEEVKKQLEEFAAELDKLRQERRQQAATLKNIMHQRDLFKSLLSRAKPIDQLTPEVFQQMVTVACSSTLKSLPSATDIATTSVGDKHGDGEKQNLVISDLKIAIEKFDAEKVRLKQEHDSIVNKLNDELSQVRHEMNELRLTATSAQNQFSSLQLMYEKLQTNSQLVRNQCDELMAKSQRLEAENLLQSRSLAEVQESRDSLQESNEKLQIELARAQSCLEMRHVELERLSDERELMCHQLDTLRQAIVSKESDLETFRTIGQKQDENNDKFMEFQQDLKCVRDIITGRENSEKELMMRFKVVSNESKKSNDETVQEIKAINGNLSSLMEMFSNLKSQVDSLTQTQSQTLSSLTTTVAQIQASAKQQTLQLSQQQKPPFYGASSVPASNSLMQFGSNPSSLKVTEQKPSISASNMQISQQATGQIKPVSQSISIQPQLQAHISSQTPKTEIENQTQSVQTQGQNIPQKQSQTEKASDQAQAPQPPASPAHGQQVSTQIPDGPIQPQISFQALPQQQTLQAAKVDFQSSKTQSHSLSQPTQTQQAGQQQGQVFHSLQPSQTTQPLQHPSPSFPTPQQVPRQQTAFRQFRPLKRFGTTQGANVAQQSMPTSTQNSQPQQSAAIVAASQSIMRQLVSSQRFTASTLSTQTQVASNPATISAQATTTFVQLGQQPSIAQDAQAAATSPQTSASNQAPASSQIQHAQASSQSTELSPAQTYEQQQEKQKLESVQLAKARKMGGSKVFKRIRSNITPAAFVKPSISGIRRHATVAPQVMEVQAIESATTEPDTNSNSSSDVPAGSSPLAPGNGSGTTTGDSDSLETTPQAQQIAPPTAEPGARCAVDVVLDSIADTSMDTEDSTLPAGPTLPLETDVPKTEINLNVPVGDQIVTKQDILSHDPVQISESDALLDQNSIEQKNEPGDTNTVATEVSVLVEQDESAKESQSETAGHKIEVKCDVEGQDGTQPDESEVAVDSNVDTSLSKSVVDKSDVTNEPKHDNENTIKVSDNFEKTDATTPKHDNENTIKASDNFEKTDATTESDQDGRIGESDNINISQSSLIQDQSGPQTQPESQPKIDLEIDNQALQGDESHPSGAQDQDIRTENKVEQDSDVSEPTIDGLSGVPGEKFISKDRLGIQDQEQESQDTKMSSVDTEQTQQFGSDSDNKPVGSDTIGDNDENKNLEDEREAENDVEMVESGGFDDSGSIQNDVNDEEEDDRNQDRNEDGSYSDSEIQTLQQFVGVRRREQQQMYDDEDEDDEDDDDDDEVDDESYSDDVRSDLDDEDEEGERYPYDDEQEEDDDEEDHRRDDDYDDDSHDVCVLDGPDDNRHVTQPNSDSDDDL